MHIISNFDLSSLNTLGVSSSCDYYCEVTDEEMLVSAVQWARSKDIPLCILAGGSNVLLDRHIHALVIQPLLKGIDVIHTKGDSLYVTAAAGEVWHDFVVFSLAQNWFGLENLVLIPGSVGAAPIQNIGAYGLELKDRFYKLKALNIKTGMIEEFFAPDCEFSYRDSIFKHKKKNRYIILAVTFLLSKKNEPHIYYSALSQEIKRQQLALGKKQPVALRYEANDFHITAAMVADAVIALRSSKLPDPCKLPNAGSFFKNPLISKEKYTLLFARYPDIVSFGSQNDSVKLAAAWLIDKLGWKGKSYAGVYVHDAQALVLTNPNRQPLDNVLRLAREIQKDVNLHFDVLLEIEPQRLM